MLPAGGSSREKNSASDMRKAIVSWSAGRLIFASRGTGSPLYGGWAMEKASHWAMVLMAVRFFGSSLRAVFPFRIDRTMLRTRLTAVGGSGTSAAEADAGARAADARAMR